MLPCLLCNYPSMSIKPKTTPQHTTSGEFPSVPLRNLRLQEELKGYLASIPLLLYLSKKVVTTYWLPWMDYWPYTEAGPMGPSSLAAPGPGCLQASPACRPVSLEAQALAAKQHHTEDGLAAYCSNPKKPGKLVNTSRQHPEENCGGTSTLNMSNPGASFMPP